jgi:hypothetical protein
MHVEKCAIVTVGSSEGVEEIMLTYTWQYFIAQVGNLSNRDFPNSAQLELALSLNLKIVV